METNWTRLVTVRELGRRRKLRVEVGDLDTGYEEDQDLCQPTYAVKVEDDVVYVDLTRSPDYAETATSPAEVD
ncbi:MAG: hypothetical protein EOP25_00820 [Rhodococcus sp. (in: high G+C Gram-positive bacteria)]|nr:MAG: hypothetical protein EOP25_00820 [Rhodococcus sp. (in: high G+C Gram-positive bacteria)]